MQYKDKIAFMLQAQKWSSSQVISSKRHLILSLTLSESENCIWIWNQNFSFVSNEISFKYHWKLLMPRIPNGDLVSIYLWICYKTENQWKKMNKWMLSEPSRRKSVFIPAWLWLLFSGLDTCFFPFWNLMLVDEIVKDSPADPIAFHPVVITSLDSPVWSLQAHSWDTVLKYSLEEMGSM